MKSVNISPGWPRLTMHVTGGCCSLLGLVGLLGWYSANEVFRSGISALSPMQPTTALSFWLCGAGLLALVRGWRCLAAVSGVAVAAMSLLTCIPYMVTVDGDIDQFFAAIESTRQPGYPGRMAPTTALCFMMSGLALVAMSRPARYRHRPLLLGAGGVGGLRNRHGR